MRGARVAGMLALALGAALADTASAAPVDLDRWDELMAASKGATLSMLAPRDTIALDTTDVTWLASVSTTEARTLDRRWTGRLREAFRRAALTTPVACLATTRRWGSVGGELTVPVVTFRRDAEVLRVAFLPREHAAVFTLDDQPVGCIRLDLAVRPWAELLGLPDAAIGDTLPPPFVDELARVIAQAAPERDSDARAMGLTGTVRVKARVGVDGTVRDAEALDGPALLHPSAIACVRQWRFEPARSEGRPVTSWMVTAVEFE